MGFSEVRGIDMYRQILCSMIADGYKIKVRKDENSKVLYNLLEDREFIDMYLKLYGRKDKYIRRLLKQAVRLETALAMSARESYELLYRVEGADIAHKYIDVCMDMDKEWWADPELHDKIFTEGMRLEYESDMLSTGGTHPNWSIERHMYGEYLFKHFLYYPEAIANITNGQILIIAQQFMNLSAQFGGNLAIEKVVKERSDLVTRLLYMPLTDASHNVVSTAQTIIHDFNTWAFNELDTTLKALPEDVRSRWVECMVLPVDEILKRREEEEKKAGDK